MNAEVKNLSVSFNNKTILKNVSFEIHGGEIIGIVGENGSGKSTLCMCIAGLLCEGEQRGGVFFDGKDVDEMSVKERCEKVGIVFQDAESQLFTGTVIDELAFAPENLCLNREEIKKRVDFALELCGISKLKDKNILNLSYGEKQLVAVASVLTMKPKLLIADEITASIDKEGRKKLKKVLADFKAEGGSVVFVSHNLSDLDIADKVIKLDGGAICE